MGRITPYVWVMTAEFEPAIIGGLGTVATQLTKAMVKSRIKVDVITRSQSHSIRLTTNKGMSILRIPTNSSYYHSITSSYKSSILEKLATRFFHQKPDIIHVHSLDFTHVALLLKRKFHIPVYYTCHSLVSMEGGGHLRRKNTQATLIRQADRIVVPSYWLKNEIRKRYSGVSSKTSVIPNGVKYKASSKSRGTKLSAHKLLFVGRLISDKGIEPLINSISLLSTKNKRVQLTVVGKGSKHYRSRLKAIARKSGTGSKIRWLGPLSHGKVQKLYSSYGAVVVPSKQESFCLVALEAMANGIPLVASRAGGLKEFVNGQNAQIITSVNSKAIARAIVAMWNNPDKTRRRVTNGRVLAKRNNWGAMAARYRTLFKHH